MNVPGDVLLVEDGRSDVQLTLRVLAEESPACRVHVTRDGEEALNLIFGLGQYSSVLRPIFALVLLDLKLPRVDGFDVLKKIKSEHSTRALPVVVFSSSSQLRDVDRSYELGANGYVQKPVGFDEFCDAIRCIADYWLGTNLSPSSGLFKETRSE